MKKKFLFPLTFLFIILFGLASCSDANNFKNQANVTIDFPVQELFNIAASREAGDDTVDVSLLITVTLYVNGTQYDSPQQQAFTSLMRDSGASFEFKNIAIGSRVKATAKVDSVSTYNGHKVTYTMLKGESPELTLSDISLELPIELEYTEQEEIDDDNNNQQPIEEQDNNNQQPIEGYENNITLEVYLKEVDINGKPVDDAQPELWHSYSTYTAFDYEFMYAKYLEEERCRELNIDYDDPDKELRTGEDWTNLGFVPGKYYPGMYLNLATAIDFLPFEADDQFSFEIDGKNIVDDEYEVTKNDGYTTIKHINYYYQTEPKTPVVMSGSAGEKNYTLNLYDTGFYIIKDSTDKNITMGMCQVYETDGSSSPESKSLMFQEMLYYENDKAKLAPFFYKDSKIYVMGSSMEEIDFAPLNGSTFAVTYRTQNPDDNFPITFTMPAGFDFSEFIKDDSGNNGNELNANFIVVFKGQPDILINQINPSEALGLNSGSASFQAASIYPNNFVPNQLGITSMTATLYYSGQEVPSSQYTTYFDGLDTLTIKPVALAHDGSYVVQIKASDANCTVSSNFVLPVVRKVVATLDVSNDDFLESLMNLLADADGAVDLTLTGSRDTIVQDYNYTADSSLYQLLGYCFMQYYNNPVTLDMSYVSGTSVEVFETNGYQGVCTSVKLAPGLRAICYKAGNMIDVSQSDSSVSAGKWYYIEAGTENIWSDAVNELLGGKPLTEDVVNSLSTEFGIYTEFNIRESNWDEVVQFLSTGAGTKSYMDYIFIKGE